MRLPNWIQVGRGWRRRRRSREGCWLFHGYMVHAVLDGAVRGRGGPGSAIVDVRGPHIGVEAASAHVRLLVRAILAWIGAGPKWAAKAVSNLFWGALRVGVCCGNYQSRTLGRGIGVSVRKRSHRPARHFVTPALQSVLQTRSCPSDSLNTRPTPEPKVIALLASTAWYPVYPVSWHHSRCTVSYTPSARRSTTWAGRSIDCPSPMGDRDRATYNTGATSRGARH